MNPHFKKLELDKILKLLSDEATVADAKEDCLNLKPKYDFDEVETELSKTDEAYVLSAKFGVPSFGRLKNVNSSLKRAETGSSLSLPEFLQISENLRVMRSVSEWRSRCEGCESPNLSRYFEEIYQNKYLEDRINTTVKSEDEIFDEASPELSRIRRKIKSEGLNVKDRLDKMIKSSSFSKYLQDAIITQRDGRYVVPVKTEYRSFVPGLVHDTSASGSTLFVEPLTVVEINNQLKVLFSKEKEETERILAELSAEVAQFSESMILSYKSLVELNVIFAKSSLAFKFKMSRPQINSEGKIKLKNARHPLIDRKKVVPISLTLGDEYDTLVITGPNTGGKTVTIKTIGLLTLMTQCGLFIPADDGSKIAVFDKILVDIGDEQSIEQSLSTFSSHIKNIVNILRLCNNNSLVLVDELGAGTDPVEGAALAASVLMELREKGGKIAATTHYNELKMYALETEGVCNASCEFDVATLKPTYRLTIGTPGSSNAFAISKKLGLSQKVVNTAKNLVSRENTRFERVVSSLEAEKRETQKEREELQSLRTQCEKLKAEYSKNKAELDKKTEKILQRARENAEYVLENARTQSNIMLAELEDLKKQNKMSKEDKVLLARKAANKGIRDIEKTIDSNYQKPQEKYVLPRDLRIGDEVLIIDLSQKATVVSEPDKNGEVLVEAGIIKTRVKIGNLKLLEKKKTENKKTGYRNVTGLKSNAERSVSMDFDIRGMNALEGIMEVDKYIDSAVLSGVNSVCIIHGKGTGVLRKAVHDYLKKNPHIKSYRLGVFGEGEAGVTIAELK